MSTTQRKVYYCFCDNKTQLNFSSQMKSGYCGIWCNTCYNSDFFDTGRDDDGLLETDDYANVYNQYLSVYFPEIYRKICNIEV